MSQRKLNKELTIQNIMNRINSSIGYSIDIEKWNKTSKTEKLLKECAKFVQAEVVYE